MRRERGVSIAWILAVALVSASTLTRGETGQTSTATGVIAGRVVDAVTGAPVAGATVTLDWVSAEAAASQAPVVRTPSGPGAARPGVQVTDETGRFEYAGLTAGRFRLQVRGGPGYRWGYFGMQTPWDVAVQGVHHELRLNERLTDIALKLWPSGSISGTVRDEFGEPIVKASLRLFERRTGPLTSGWTRTPVSAETDDRGQYRLGDRPNALPGPGPGDYVVVVTAPRSGPDTVAAFAGAVFSGGTRSIADAQVIALGTGEHRTGIDIVVPTTPGAGFGTLRGRIVNHTVLQPADVGRKPLEPLRLRLIPSGTSGELANFLEIVTTARSDGQFTFPPVAAGDYRLKAWQFSEGVAGGSPPVKVLAAPTWTVDVPVHVDASMPVEDRLISLHAAARITGRVVFDGDSPPPAVNEIRFVPLEDHPDRTVGTIRTRVDADGRFATPGLLPGQYLVIPDTALRRPDRPLELLWQPLSMVVDAREVEEPWVPVGTNDIDLTITLSDRRAVLIGTIRDTRGQPRPDARVIMFGQRCLRLIAPDRFGAFEFPAEARGCSFAAVIDPPRTWYEPEYLKTLTPFAVPANTEQAGAAAIGLIVRP